MFFVGAKPWKETPLNLGGQIRLLTKSLRSSILDGTVTLHPALGEEV